MVAHRVLEFEEHPVTAKKGEVAVLRDDELGQPAPGCTPLHYGVEYNTVYLYVRYTIQTVQSVHIEEGELGVCLVWSHDTVDVPLLGRLDHGPGQGDTVPHTGRN